MVHCWLSHLIWLCLEAGYSEIRKKNTRSSSAHENGLVLHHFTHHFTSFYQQFSSIYIIWPAIFINFHHFTTNLHHFTSHFPSTFHEKIPQDQPIPSRGPRPGADFHPGGLRQIRGPATGRGVRVLLDGAGGPVSTRRREKEFRRLELKWVWTWKCWVNLPNEIAI